MDNNNNEFTEIFGAEDALMEAEKKNSPVSQDPVPYGTYEVRIEKLAGEISKSGNPMLVCWFRILEGDQSHKIIFKNQAMTKGWMVGREYDFLNSLDTLIDIGHNTPKPKNFSEFKNLCSKVFEGTKGLVYELSYKEDAKGFRHWDITDVFDVE